MNKTIIGAVFAALIGLLTLPTAADIQKRDIRGFSLGMTESEVQKNSQSGIKCDPVKPSLILCSGPDGESFITVHTNPPAFLGVLWVFLGKVAAGYSGCRLDSI